MFHSKNKKIIGRCFPYVNRLFCHESNYLKSIVSIVQEKYKMKAYKYFGVILLAVVFALPVNGSAQAISKVVKVTTKQKQGYLGVELKDVDRKLKEKKNLTVDNGAYIQNVVEDSPAEKAGLKKGDVIVKFGDESIDDSEDLTEAVRGVKPKSVVKVELYRGSEKKSVEVKVGKNKSPAVFNFNVNDDGITQFRSVPKLPNISRNLNFMVKTQAGIGGLRLQSLTKQLGEYFSAPDGKGILVTEVKKESNAAKAGFKAGDVIVKVDKHTIEEVSDFGEELSDQDAKEVPVEIIRNGKEMKLTLTIEDDEENNDDDWSGNAIVMPNHFQSHSFNFCIPLLSNVREKLNDLRRHLHDIKISVHRRMLEN